VGTVEWSDRSERFLVDRVACLLDSQPAPPLHWPGLSPSEHIFTHTAKYHYKGVSARMLLLWQH